ncbi:hypothetical protein [Streptomyces chiangmaiensis]|uniref:Uncharacterized protein n=1 Tax=Streptomyces chiangmaiensis TaxID=766497 RepID=A0ABU7FIS3_9ACTN|nr:hypothetical protein [Streptomyces chiangmaiensis]MED7823044.1 hypothetical protein [Streptomyces chiangmaiensis]
MDVELRHSRYGRRHTRPTKEAAVVVAVQVHNGDFFARGPTWAVVGVQPTFAPSRR